MLRVVVLAVATVALGFAIYLTRSHVVSWSEDALLRRRMHQPPTAVYFTRRNASVLPQILVHALLARQPCIILYPIELTQRSDYNPKLLTERYPFITLMDLPDPNAFSASFVRSLRTRLSSGRYSLYLPDLSLVRAYHHPASSGFDELFRYADSVTLFEEGTFSYNVYIPNILTWRSEQARSEEAGRAALTALHEKFRRGEVDRKAIPPVGLPSFASYRYFISRLDLVAQADETGFQRLDLTAGWRKLSESERKDVLEFFKFDRESFLSPRPERRSLPKLVILGAAYFSNEQEIQLRRWIDMIYRKYSHQHEMFFKPHPLESRLDNYVRTTYPENQIVRLDARIPFELLGLEGITFDKHAIAGFSTVLLSVPPTSVVSVFDWQNDKSLAERMIQGKIVSADKVSTTVEE